MRIFTRRLLGWLVLALSLLVAADPVFGLGGQRASFRPVDEADTDPSFASFRRDLLEALAALDVAFLASHLDPALRATADWFVVRGTPTTTTSEMRKVLRLGGSFTTSRGAITGRREFCAPYIYSKYPNTFPDIPGVGSDEGHPWAVIKEHVPAYRGASEKTAVVTI